MKKKSRKSSNACWQKKHFCRKQLKGQETGNVSVVVVVIVLKLTRIIKSVVTGQAPVTLELRNTLGKNTNNPRWYTPKSQLTQFMPPPETYKSEIGSLSTMGEVHTGAHVSLLAPLEKPTITPLATQERLPRTYYT